MSNETMDLDDDYCEKCSTSEKYCECEFCSVCENYVPDVVSFEDGDLSICRECALKASE